MLSILVAWLQPRPSRPWRRRGRRQPPPTARGPRPTASPPATRTTPPIAANRNGHVAVVWEDDRDSDRTRRTTPTARSACACSRDGTSPYEIKLSAGGTAGTTWRHVSPDVGLDDKGNAVVVWADDPDGNGFYNIPYRVVSPTGTVARVRPRQRRRRRRSRSAPKVAVDPDGAPGSATAVAFTVVWEDIQGTARPRSGRPATPAPTTKAYEVTGEPDHRRAPPARTSRSSASGDAVVVWDEDADANGFYNVGLVRLAKANGAVTLSRRTANATGDGQQRQPGGRGELHRRLRGGVGVRPHRHRRRVDPLVHRRRRRRGTPTWSRRPAPARRARRSASTTRPTRSSAGPSPAPTRRLGPRASTPTARRPAGCAAQVAEPDDDRSPGAARGGGVAVGRGRASPTPTTTTATRSTRSSSAPGATNSDW